MAPKALIWSGFFHIIIIVFPVAGDKFKMNYFFSIRQTRLALCCICVMNDDVIKWKHFPRYWPFVRGIHRSPVNSPPKGQWWGALMFSLICFWIIDWVKKSWGWWFETLSYPLWRLCNEEKLSLFLVTYTCNSTLYFSHGPSGWLVIVPGQDDFNTWASCQIRKIAGCACAGNAGNVFPCHCRLAIPTCIKARAWRTCRDACRDR